ncbi:MAG: nuclear transport factor 2 family protein [Gammaproteobacteria bacterium]|jgi:ketosteroid isomerase-like protein|nr:nuclear transport factor 2 family protein [Gammaproteobacteria bacterium]MDH5227976.1 nuclear transport factor 2 family protein [Gammaproteobacteria bacterium]
MRNTIVALAICLMAGHAAADPIACTAVDDPDVAAIHHARDAFNRAIAVADAGAIRAVLAKDAILVTGTDSSTIVGRDAQVAVWQEDFDADHRAVYVRTPTCVSLSPLAPIALEIGAWRGVDTRPGHDEVAGVYTAKWRRTADGWQLEAEIFATQSCSGSYCPKTRSE